MHLFQTPLTRRRLLLGTGALAACTVLPNVLFANTGGSGRLVVVILRGALDGLAAVPPHGDPDYAGLHRELAIAPPGGPTARSRSTPPSVCIPRSGSCTNATSPGS